jgi:hypothetical protein
MGSRARNTGAIPVHYGAAISALKRLRTAFRKCLTGALERRFGLGESVGRRLT